MEDQVEGTMRGRMGLRRELKKSQRCRLRGKKKEVVDLRWIPRVEAEDLMKPVNVPQTLGRPGGESCF